MGRILFTYKKPSSGSCIELGLMYNWYAVTDTRKITSEDTWRIPLEADYYTYLIKYLQPSATFGSNTVGNELKQVGTSLWLAGNGGTDDYNLSLVGGGYRSPSGGAFSALFNQGNYGYLTISNGWAIAAAAYNSNQLSVGAVTGKDSGKSLRLVRDATVDEQLLDDGTYLDSYIGNDGQSYKVVKIGTRAWMAENLMETKFRNGDIIPYAGTDPSGYFTDAEWDVLTTAGVCAYNNDVSYVGCDFSFPI